MNYKCIIFDCDGVLVDSEAISAKVFYEMVLELDCNLNYGTILDQITGTSMKENLEFFAQHIDGEMPADFEQDFRKRSFEAYKKELEPINGIHSLINKLTVPFCTASSGPQNKIKLNLTTTGLIDKFEGKIFSSFDIDSWKPEPKIYLHAAEQMGFEPKDCVVIEDSEPGVKAAVAGGFNVCVITNKKNKSIFEKLGAKVFYTMKELEVLLDL